MQPRLRSRWITINGTPLFGFNLTGYGSNRQGVIAEIQAAEKFLAQQARNSQLVDMDVADTEMMPEIIDFIHSHSGQESDPIRKLAIIGIPDWKRFWYRVTKKITWPKHAKFFDAHEDAKAWLLSERF